MSTKTQRLQLTITLGIGKILLFSGLAIAVQRDYFSQEAEESNDVAMLTAIPIHKTVQLNHLRDGDRVSFRKSVLVDL